MSIERIGVFELPVAVGFQVDRKRLFGGDAVGNKLVAYLLQDGRFSAAPDAGDDFDNVFTDEGEDAVQVERSFEQGHGDSLSAFCSR